MAAKISDQAVKAKTGKSWQQWFKILEAAGAARMSHKEIVAWLGKKSGISSWWQQMVTVTYEQLSGKREKHERPDGYSVSVSKTVGVPIAALYKTWADDKIRSRWFGNKAITIRRATLNKSMRITWSDGRTNLDVGFYDQGSSKSQVVLDHSRIASAAAAEKMKAYWKKALDELLKVL